MRFALFLITSPFWGGKKIQLGRGQEEKLETQRSKEL